MAKDERNLRPPDLELWRRASATGPAATADKPAAAAESSGFSARLQGAALFDLIQIECLSRAPKVVRVSSAGRAAMLFFREGRLVHAVAGRAIGEPAVAELLAWGEGVFEPCERPWPAVETIVASLEQVLLRAAQAVDERRGPNVLALPVREPDRRPQPHMEKVEPMKPSRLAPPGLAGVDVELWVQLSAAGDIVEHEGAGGEEFADAIAYATQLADLVGELLGLERPTGVELSFERGKCLIHRQPDGAVLALKPGRGSTIEALRAKLEAEL